MPAFSRRTNSSVNRAVGSQDHSGECGYPRNPLRRDAKEGDSGVAIRRPEFEGDIRYQVEQRMEEQGPAERQRDKVGEDPGGQAVEGPGVGEEADPSQEPVLDEMSTDQGELDRS